MQRRDTPVRPAAAAPAIPGAVASEIAQLDESIGQLTSTIHERTSPEGLRAVVRDVLAEGAAPTALRTGYPGPSDTAGGTTRSGGRNGLLRRGDSMTTWLREHRDAGGYSDDELENFSLGRAIQLMVRPDLVDRSDGEYEKRALSEGTDASGGFLTPEVLSGPMIDKLRNATHVVRAGATVVPVDSDNHSLPRLAADPTPGWKEEGAAVTLSDPTFERVTFEVKMLQCTTKLSYELFEDMTPASAGIIEKALISALGLELDRVALRGSGTDPEPEGVLNQTGVTLQTNGTNGAAASWAMLTNAVAALQARNVDPTAAIAHSRYEQSLALLADSTGQPLQPAPYIANLPRLTTSQIPINLTVGSSTNCSEIYVGNWADLFIGVRPSLGVRTKILNETYAGTMEVGIQSWIRADIQLAHAASFQVVTGVRP